MTESFLYSDRKCSSQVLSERLAAAKADVNDLREAERAARARAAASEAALAVSHLWSHMPSFRTTCGWAGASLRTLRLVRPTFYNGL